MKRFLGIDLFFIMIMCLFGGVMDGYSFLCRGDTFCFIQTGNLIRTIIFYIQKNIESASYSLIIFIVFVIFVFLYYLFLKLIRNIRIDFRLITLIFVSLLILPSYFLKFDDNNYLNANNIITGSCLSMAGSMIAVTFKEIHFKKDHSISFNAAMMTGNARSMMIAFAEFFYSKNKIKGGEALCFLCFIIMFSLGIGSSALIETNLNSNGYIFIFLMIYILLFLLIIMSFFREK